MTETLLDGMDSLRDLSYRPTLLVWDALEAPVGCGAERLDVENILVSGSADFTPLRLSAEQIAVEPAFICFSSGTSGLVKGVRLSHGNVVANIHQQGATLRGMFTPETRFALAVPMFHILGLAGFCCQYVAHVSTH